jgi:cytoskeletal protein RodZ
MKEKFEHKLIQKIKDVFDSNQPEYNPQDWENMKAKLSENNVRKVPVFWTMLKVASVLLILLIGSYIIWQRLSQPVDQVTEKGTEKSISIFQGKSDDIQQPEKEVQSQDSRILSEPIRSGPVNEPAETIANNVLTEALKNDDSVLLGNESSEIVKTDTAFAIAITNENETINTELSQNLNSENAQETNEQVLPLVPIESEPEITYSENHKQKQKVKIGVELASFTNYASEELVPEMNFGAGLTANIPIRSRFSFAPGINLSSYNMQVENTDQLSNKNTTTTTSGINTIDALIESNPDIKPIGVELTGLDIPLNFQYCFIRKPKSNYFVELGFSSLLYLSEKYDYTVTEITGTNSDGTYTYGQTYSGETETPAFETFDFASLLNFSLGWDYRISRGFGLTLNPYIKYPVSTMTSGDIKFGSGGIKLKFMIIPKN